MTLQIEIPTELESSLIETAKANGLTPQEFLRRLLESQLAAVKPSPHFGALAKFGAAPSEEDISATRSEMFRRLERA